jgi:hypothetical protein
VDDQDKPDPLPGFQKFGYNAYILLAQLQSTSSSAGGHSLMDILNRVGPALRQQDFAKKYPSFTQYRLDTKGEPHEPNKQGETSRCSSRRSISAPQTEHQVVVKWLFRDTTMNRALHFEPIQGSNPLSPSVYFLSLVFVTAPEAYFHRVNAESFEFVKGYWFADRLRYCELFGLVLVFCVVFLTDSLRPLHQKQFGRYRQESVPFGWVAAGKILGCFSLLCAVYVIPFLNLHIPTLVLNVGKVAWASCIEIESFCELSTVLHTSSHWAGPIHRFRCKALPLA